MPGLSFDGPSKFIDPESANFGFFVEREKKIFDLFSAVVFTKTKESHDLSPLSVAALPHCLLIGVF